MKRNAITVFLSDEDKQKLLEYQKDFKDKTGMAISKAEALNMALKVFFNLEHIWPEVAKELINGK